MVCGLVGEGIRINLYILVSGVCGSRALDTSVLETVSEDLRYYMPLSLSQSVP